MKKVINILAFVQYTALILATVSVLCFQFLPYVFCVYIALGGYTLGFFLISVRCIINCAQIFWASKKIKEQGQGLVVSNNIEVLDSKTEKSRSIILSILSLLIFAFALIVLIMYPIATA